jgi:signal transduction histidine kinase/ActR/RegA family two-component response regulator
MKLFLMKHGKLLRHNLREILFVFLAFAMMAAAAYFSVGQILRSRLLDGAREMISVAEANVRAGFYEAETILLSTHRIVQGMIFQNAPRQEILDYLTITTEWMRQRDHGLLGYYGIYGYINGEFYDSVGLNPGSDFIPQTRPWYQAAVRSGTEVAYTTPYTDSRTGDSVVSAVRNIFDINGRRIGILTLDVEISWLAEYVRYLAAASGGYGILMNQNMTLITHPNASLIGMQLQDLGGSYGEFARILRSGGDVLAHRTDDITGNSVIVFFNRIFNGWYIGVVIPYHLFFRDLYISAVILILLGLVLSVLLCSMLLNISAAKMRSDDESKSKSSFLASMSHEIRTPMNAITGMAELMLRGELTDEARSYAQDIKKAGNNLISIINDILDISKIEAGKLEIIYAKYMFSSLINDTVNIVRLRIGDKPIQFTTNIDGNIPNRLIGDEVRLRQIFLNLLSNAVKYTKQGHVSLTVTGEKRIDKQIWLKVIVSDTGSGIKAEDQESLFSDFVQVDAVKNRGIEGTGLGLAITKRLCAAMGGNISMESEYGKGTTFTVIIPQGTELQISPSAAQDADNKTDNSGKDKFTISNTQILVVDDISTNLKVAEGLLQPYKARIDTCLSGAIAIELIKKNDYDLVFMDHMMPEMDGIETVRHIRTMGKQFPVIALTANAVLGMREMFLEKGFNDFLAKPIDVSKLDEVLGRWIPEEKKEIIPTASGSGNDSAHGVLSSSFPEIPGVDTRLGITRTGGTLVNYKYVLSIFRNDAEERLLSLHNAQAQNNLSLLTTHVHAIKSASGSVGAIEISERAAKLEAAGRAGDLEFIGANLKSFTEDLEKLNKNIHIFLQSGIEEESREAEPLDSFAPLLRELAEALETKKAASDIFVILDTINEKPQDNKTKEIMDKISYQVLMNEFDNAIKIIKENL